MVKLGHVDNQILWSISGPCSFSMLLIIGESTFSKWLIRYIVNQYFEFKIGLHSNWPIEFKIILNFRAKGLQKKYSEAVISENEKINFWKIWKFSERDRNVYKKYRTRWVQKLCEKNRDKRFRQSFQCNHRFKRIRYVIFSVKNYSVNRKRCNYNPFLGKSNILDSICFLLGIQQLSQVRASNLTELVYKVNYSHFYGTFYGIEFRMVKQVSSERPCQLRLTIATKVLW